MKEINKSTIEKWLSAQGESRLQAVEEAANFLLDKYLQSWPNLIPIELNRLAAIHRSQIVRLKDMKGIAFLMPVENGFRILVRAGLVVGRFRSSVAHEIAHTLFYNNTKRGRPQRIIPHKQREEPFCFDVARRLLAPIQHLESIGIFKESDPEVIFFKLIKTLQISRPWAARIMLGDYSIVRGVAGRWKKQSKGWELEFGSATATPDLSPKERKIFREKAKRYLEDNETPGSGHRIISLKEKTGKGAFIVVTSSNY